ncbi:MAG: DUF4296 domain-containing protein [Flavobacteriaceae bacterium]
MKKYLGFVCLALISFQCQDSSEIPPPQNLIPEAKMTSILVDLSIMESLRNSSRGTLVYGYEFSMEYIYQKYGVDSLQLIHSRGYYAQNPKKFLEMHEASEYRLERMVDSMNRLKKEARKKKRD